ncbi:MAG: DUF4105 domain-containing protein [Gemmatimonadales bacterium]
MAGVLLLAATARPLVGQQSLPPGSAIPGAELTVLLMTMGPGERVWERFGHNAIWVQDRLRGTSLAYNFGLFSFQQENFALRFLQGRMRYWMEGFDALPYAETYVRDRRSVWVQELELPPQARLALRDFLEWNQRPENRFYRYEYYRDNCSTRVRDVLDRALGGRIRRQTETVMTGTTYRFHTSRLTAADPPVATGLLLLVGPDADRELSAWEEGFVPEKLRQHLRLVTVPGPDGRPVPLVKAERALSAADAFPVPGSPPDWLPAFLMGGIVIGGAIALSGQLGPRQLWARMSFVGLAGVWTLLTGIVGLVLTGLWTLTDHTIAYWNQNLFQANLFALGLLFLAGPLARGAAWARRPARGLAVLVAALSVAGLLAKLLPVMPQGNGPIIALMLPANLGLAWGTWQVALPRTRPSA